MKCYFTIVAPEKEGDVYVNMLEVAIKSAQQNTTLQICVLYDGPTEHYCYRMLEKYGVQIINHTFSHEKDIYQLFDKDFCGRTKNPKLIASTFMRIDIPFLEQEEEYVLYADVDVLFTRDVRLEDLPRPEVLAACGEFSVQKDMNIYFNAGILLLNVKNMRRYCEMIFHDLENGVVVNGFDQGYLNKYCLNVRTWLPVEYNWKPYWGINKDAVIIHYHGMKPGGTNETSGFGMSDRVILNTTKNGSNLAGYAYYYAVFFHILDSADEKKWMEWLANLLGLALNLRLTQQESLYKTEINKERDWDTKSPEYIHGCLRDWLKKEKRLEQLYLMDKSWLERSSRKKEAYLLEKIWIEAHGNAEALYQLERKWLESTRDEKAVYLLDKAWLEKKGDEEALYNLNRAWLEKTADEKAVYLLDKAWLEKRGDEEALYKLNRAWLKKAADEKAVYLLDKSWLEKHGEEEALYKLNRAWLKKAADEKAVYLLDKAWLEKRGDEEALYRLNRAWLEKTADEKDVYLLDKAWLEKRGEKDAIYLHEKAWLAKHGTREEQYRHERKHLISIREDKQKLYQLDCEWLRSNKDYDSLHRLEKDWLIAHKASADEIFELDCKWYQQTGKIAEWYNLKKSRLLRIGSLREIRTFENTHEIRRRSYLRIGKWLYLRRRWQGNTRQVVLRIGRREWILFKVHKRTIN